MTLVSNLLAVSFLLLFLGVVVGAFLAERPVASCSRCRRSFDSAPAFMSHVLECEDAS